MDIRVKLRAWLECYRVLLAQSRERQRAKNAAFNKFLGADKPRTMSRIFLYIHALIATGLIAATFYWLTREYVELGKAFPRGAMLYPFVLPSLYLFTVHIFTRKPR